MTNAPKPKTPVGSPDSRKQGLTQGEPQKRAFGARTDDMPTKNDPSKAHDKGAKQELTRPGVQPANVQGKSGGDANKPTTTPEVKPTRLLSDGRPV